MGLGGIDLSGWTFFAGLAAAADGKDPRGAKLDNASCQTCHDGKKGKLEVEKDDGDKRALHEINPDKYAKSVHAKMECVTCHKISLTALPHTR